MIPRVRVNYGWRDLLAACRSRRSTHREELRAALATRFEVGEVLLTPSGRGGLYFILRAAPQPRVVIPAYTCNAVIEAATLAGKEVVCVDAAANGFNSSVTDLADLLDTDTAFIATHQYGIPCDIVATAQLCRERGALLIEDCAASLGSRVRGQLTGTFGDLAFFSFDSTKLVNVPLKAGFVIARDPEWLAAVRAAYEAGIEPMPAHHQRRLLGLATGYVALRSPRLYGLYHRFALRQRYTAETAELSATRTEFYRYDVTEWQAAIALPQIARLDALVDRRRALYAGYRGELTGCHHLALPPSDARGEWACIRFPILVQGDKLAWYRRANQRGVDFAFSFTHLASPPECEHAQALAREVLDLPFYDALEERELRRTVRVLRSLDRKASRV
jgi:dTDP-4-amino-4,6-dideoxygalactose transaminase